MKSLLAPEEIKHFKRDGAVLIKGKFEKISRKCFK